ncbi:MAG: PQQ-binding-like beta-propeller repeat protein [Acidobacteriota bacterium]|nr:PQQ-binding-like beta-propeller repeat protein [Acidobacteriota bacterium]
MLKLIRTVGVVAGFVAMMTLPVRAQTGAPGGEWPTYGGDLGHTRYAPLDQITAENFEELEVAWRFKTDNLGPVPEFRFQSTPLVVDGVLYSTAGSRRTVVALDAATGELRWVYRLNEGPRGAAAPRQLSGRGLAYWAGDETERARVVFVTPGYRLVALEAESGRPVQGFGFDGVVDLKQENDQQIDPTTGEVGLHATPIVADDVVIVGAAHRTGGNPRSRANVKG